MKKTAKLIREKRKLEAKISNMQKTLDEEVKDKTRSKTSTQKYLNREIEKGLILIRNYTSLIDRGFNK